MSTIANTSFPLSKTFMYKTTRGLRMDGIQQLQRIDSCWALRVRFHFLCFAPSATQALSFSRFGQSFARWGPLQMKEPEFFVFPLLSCPLGFATIFLFLLFLPSSCSCWAYWHQIRKTSQASNQPNCPQHPWQRAKSFTPCLLSSICAHDWRPDMKLKSLSSSDIFDS